MPKDKLSKQAMARAAATMFLDIGAVGFRPEEPYIFASGLASPVYVDCRKLISYPRERTALMDFATDILLEKLGADAFDAVAGGETAGIPFAAWIADRMNLPMLYVRKKPKGYGRDAQIEGDIKEGQRVLLVEDLSTDGGSKLNFIKALRTAGATCAHTVVVFYYDIFKETPARLADEGLELHSILTWWDILAVAREHSRESNRFDEDTLRQVEEFLHAPVAWSQAHGGTYNSPA